MIRKIIYIIGFILHFLGAAMVTLTLGFSFGNSVSFNGFSYLDIEGILGILLFCLPFIVSGFLSLGQILFSFAITVSKKDMVLSVIDVLIFATYFLPTIVLFNVSIYSFYQAMSSQYSSDSMYSTGAIFAILALIGFLIVASYFVLVLADLGIIFKPNLQKAKKLV